MALSKDNKKTNAMIDAGKLPESQRENVPQITPQGLTASLQKAQNALNQKTGQNVPLAGVGSTIKSTDFSGGQQQPKITPVAPPTQGAGLAGEIQQRADSFTQQLQADRKAKETALVQPRTDIQDFLKNLRGETTLTSEAYGQKGGVDAIDVELKNINNQILQEQVGLQRQIEKLEKNAQGMFAGGLEDQINDVQRESIRKQADLSVIQMGIQGRYDSAKAIADRAVSAYMEKQKNEYEALKFNYEENKDLFTRAEQREFEALSANRKRELDKEEEDKKNIYAIGLDAQQNGAPSSAVQAILAAKTPEEALKAGGSYIGALERQAKLASIANTNLSNRIALAKLGDPKAIAALGFDPRKVEEDLKTTELTAVELRQKRDRIQANTELTNLMTEYKALLDDVGFEGSTFGGTNLGKYDALRGRITTVLKKAEALGTLDTGVLQLVDKLIGESPEKSWANQNVFGFQARRISSALGTQISLINSNLNIDKKTLGDFTFNVKEDDINDVNDLWDTETSTPNK